MQDFARRVDQRRVILEELRDPALWFWTPAFRQALDWLKARVAPGGTVVDVGCGLGFFLHALKDEGFSAVGLDVAERAVELNRRDGFDVWHGPVESLPPDWVVPDAIVSFFMLHHLEDPLGFLTALRKQGRNAPLAIVAYGPTNLGGPASLPPRTLTRWNEKALVTALDLTGYVADVRGIESSGAELPGVAGARSVLARLAVFPRVYRLGKRLESRALSIIPKRVRRESYVLLALAEPK